MHDEHSQSRNELWLAHQLQEAAHLEDPQFSESLHERIMQAIRLTVVDAAVGDSAVGESAVGESAVEPIRALPGPAIMERSNASRRRARWLTTAWLTSVAALLAMVFAAQWFAGTEDHNDSQQRRPTAARAAAVQRGHDANQVVANPAVPTGSSELVDPSSTDAVPDDVASAAANYTLDDLSHDAQATAHVLVDQLPFETPTDEWGL